MESDPPAASNNDFVATVQSNPIENIDQDTVTGESSNSVTNKVWQRDVCGLYKPSCPPGITPAVGMCFPDLLSGINFYRTYAATCGFVTRLGTQKTSRVSITLKYVLCAKEGERFVKPPESESGPRDADEQTTKRRRCKTTRTGCEAMISLKLVSGNRYVISKFVEDHNHPFITDYQKSRSSRNPSRARVPPQPESLAAGTRGNNTSPQQKTDDLPINTQIWNALNSILSHPTTSYADRVALLETIKQHRVLQSTSDHQPSNQVRPSMESLSGITQPVAPIPKVCKNKGSGPRKLSDREKATNISRHTES